MMKFTLVIYNGGGDEEVKALYDENDKLILYGDYYHDKISHKIDGFEECLNHLGIKHKIKVVEKESEDPYKEIGL